jgi:nucleotide-binding universal stress UspA family protein
VRTLRRGAPPEPPAPSELRPKAVLLASEERTITRAAIDQAARLAEPGGAPVYVFAIARVHGTNFGFPNPGLLPNKQEWDAQRTSVQRAVKALRKRGLRSEGRVVGTRSAAKKIVREAERLGCEAIVMGADESRSAWVADFIWSQEPQRVRKRARIPVYLVTSSD